MNPRGLALALSAVVLVLTLLSTTASASGNVEAVIWSDAEAGTTTKTGSVFGSRCGSGSANAAEESATLALMDDWAAEAVAADFTYLSAAQTPADDVSGDSAVLAFPGVSDVTVTVSRRQVSSASASDPTDGSTGALSNNAAFSDSARLQDCAPRPADLSSAPAGMQLPNPVAFSGLGSDPTTFWNATRFPAGNQLDGALFEFSRPVGAFGLWFGDLETRNPEAAGGAVLAVVKLLDADGNVIQATEILPEEAITNDATCGGSAQSSDHIGCGNQASRFIGFVDPDESVAAMLVTVGDDDSCAQTSRCNGITEYLSWIGPMLAEGQPDLTTTKSLNAPAPTAIGDSVSWTLTVANVGHRDAAPGWTLTDVPGAGLAGLTLTGDPSEVDCTALTSCIGLVPLAKNETITVTASATHEAPFGVDVHNAAYVTPEPTDIIELVEAGMPPLADDDSSLTSTNNDGNVVYAVAEPPATTTTMATTTTTQATATTLEQTTVPPTTAAPTTAPATTAPGALPPVTTTSAEPPVATTALPTTTTPATSQASSTSSTLATTETDLQVQGANASNSAGNTRSNTGETLAFTGSSTWWTLGLAVLLILSGSILVRVVGRGQRRLPLG